MQAVKGFISDGVFTPSYETAIPNQAEVILVFAASSINAQSAAVTVTSFDEIRRQARIEGLKKIKAALDEVDDEDLIDFPKQGAMKLPHEYAWND